MPSKIFWNIIVIYLVLLGLVFIEDINNIKIAVRFHIIIFVLISIGVVGRVIVVASILLSFNGNSVDRFRRPTLPLHDLNNQVLEQAKISSLLLHSQFQGSSEKYSWEQDGKDEKSLESNSILVHSTTFYLSS